MIQSFIFRFGRRKTILVCLFLLPVTAGVTAISPNIYFFVVVKFFCGLCGAMLMTTSVLGGYVPVVLVWNVICLRRFSERAPPKNAKVLLIAPF